LPSTDFQCRSAGSLRSGEPDQNGAVDTKISASRGSSGASSVVAHDSWVDAQKLIWLFFT
jgi:hypothetical protein